MITCKCNTTYNEKTNNDCPGCRSDVDIERAIRIHREQYMYVREQINKVIYE